MPLVSMKDMLVHAHTHGYAVGAFDLVDLAFLEGVLAGAERAKSPVILSVAESHFRYFPWKELVAAAENAAKRASVPVAIHLDHGASLRTAREAIAAGCNGVMVDASHLPFAENVRLTREVVEMAHACGVPVEGELGYVPGVEGEDATLHPGQLRYTEPEEAARFVKETGVDFLAVSIGTVHGRMKGEPRLDLERLAAINASLGIPLVIHGGTGLTDKQFHALIARGVSKINYYTALSDAAAETIRRNLTEGATSYPALHTGVRDAVAREVERCAHIWGSAGRAEEVLRVARPWEEVEHLVLFNTALSDAEVQALFAEGARELGEIPGVRRIFTGKTMREDARYSWVWVIRFCAPEVAEHYRIHPAHERFASMRFRPHAEDRLTQDFCGQDRVQK